MNINEGVFVEKWQQYLFKSYFLTRFYNSQLRINEQSTYSVKTWRRRSALCWRSEICNRAYDIGLWRKECRGNNKLTLSKLNASTLHILMACVCTLFFMFKIVQPSKHFQEHVLKWLNFSNYSSYLKPNRNILSLLLVYLMSS